MLPDSSQALKRNTALCFVRLYLRRPRKASEPYLTVHIKSHLNKSCKGELGWKTGALCKRDTVA